MIKMYYEFEKFKEDYKNDKLVKDGINIYLDLDDYEGEYSHNEIYGEIENLIYEIKKFLKERNDSTWVCGMGVECVAVVSKEFNDTLKFPIG
jgi:hypothetical protein